MDTGAKRDIWNDTILYKCIGTKVMCRSNEDDPIRVGIIVRFELIHETAIPVVVCDDDHKEIFAMSLVLPYNPTFKKLLETLPNKEQWKILSDVVGLHSDIRGVYKRE